MEDIIYFLTDLGLKCFNEGYLFEIMNLNTQKMIFITLINYLNSL